MKNLATQIKGKRGEVPAIYVADLADYNAGNLRGKWIEIDQYTTVEDLQEEIAEMLAEKGHEEYAIHDYNNFPGTAELGEYPNLETIIEVAQAVYSHGYDLISAYLIYFSVDELSQFEDRYQGTFGSVADYARELLESTVEDAIGNLESYFDYQSYGEDLEINGDFISADLPGRYGNEVAIFYCS
jgi:antirestriction protein